MRWLMRLGGAAKVWEVPVHMHGDHSVHCGGISDVPDRRSHHQKNYEVEM